MKKSIVWVLAVLMILSVFVGCQSSAKNDEEASAVKTKEEVKSTEGKTETKKAEKQQEYAFVLSLSQLEFFNDPKAGLFEAAEQLGVKVTVAGPTELESQGVSTAIEELVAKGVDGILVWGQFPGITDDAINSAIDAGTPVITIGADIPDSNRLTCIMADQVKIGAKLADLTADAIDGKGKVATMNILSAGSQQAIERQDGFEARIAEKYPDIEVVERLDDKADPVIAPTVAATAIQKHPDLAALIGFMAPSGVGAATAVREAGKIGDVKVIAVDRDEGTLDLLESGEIESSVVAKSYVEGYWGMQMIYAYKNGLCAGMFPSDEQRELANVSALPDFLDSGIAVITKDTVDAWRH